MSISQNSQGDNGANTLLKKEKKNRKIKIPVILSIKKRFAKTKHSVINNLVNNFANITSSKFLQVVRNQADYKNCVLVYFYYLFFILCDFN